MGTLEDEPIRFNLNGRYYSEEALINCLDSTLGDWYISHISYAFPGANQSEEITMVGGNKVWGIESQTDKYFRQTEEARQKHIKEVQQFLDDIFDENMNFFQGKINRQKGTNEQ